MIMDAFSLSLSRVYSLRTECLSWVTATQSIKKQIQLLYNVMGDGSYKELKKLV